MTPAEIRALQKRWTKSEVRAVESQLKKGRLGDLPRIETRGRSYIDLRGFRPAKPVLRLNAEYIDLSYSVFKHIAGLGQVRLRNSLFSGWKYEGSLSSEFVSCDFSNSLMQRTQGLPREKFVGCDFRGTDLSRSEFLSVEFVDCDFQGAILKRVVFSDCVLDGCDFLGATFGKGSFAGSHIKHAKRSLTWLDFDYEEPVTHDIPGAQTMVDLKDTEMSQVLIDNIKVRELRNERL